MTITVLCGCGARVRGETSRFKKGPACPRCGRRLSARPEPKDDRRIPFQCMCGLEMKFPYRRGGLWFECPQCGRKSVIPGRGSSLRQLDAVDLPAEPTVEAQPRSLVPVLVALGLLAALAAVAFVLL